MRERLEKLKETGKSIYSEFGGILESGRISPTEELRELYRDLYELVEGIPGIIRRPSGWYKIPINRIGRVLERHPYYRDIMIKAAEKTPRLIEKYSENIDNEKPELQMCVLYNLFISAGYSLEWVVPTAEFDEVKLELNERRKERLKVVVYGSTTGMGPVFLALNTNWECIGIEPDLFGNEIGVARRNNPLLMAFDILTEGYNIKRESPPESLEDLSSLLEKLGVERSYHPYKPLLLAVVKELRESPIQPVENVKICLGAIQIPEFGIDVETGEIVKISGIDVSHIPEVDFHTTGMSEVGFKRIEKIKKPGSVEFRR